MPTIRIALVLTFLLPAAALAQTELVVAAGGGLTFPLGDAASTHGKGPNAGLRVVWPLSPRLAVQGALDWRDLGRDDGAALERLGREPSEFWSAGGFVDGANRQTLAALVHGQLTLRPRGTGLVPYVVAGGGLARTRVTDLEVFYLGEWERHPGSGETVLAAEMGAGLEVGLSRGVSLFGQAGYLLLLTEDATAMVPVQLGISVDLAGT